MAVAVWWWGRAVEADRVRRGCVLVLGAAAVLAVVLLEENMAREDEAGGVGLNWASEGLEFVNISVVDFARRLGESMGEPVESSESWEEGEEG